MEPRRTGTWQFRISSVLFIVFTNFVLPKPFDFEPQSAASQIKVQGARYSEAAQRMINR